MDEATTMKSATLSPLKPSTPPGFTKYYLGVDQPNEAEHAHPLKLLLLLLRSKDDGAQLATRTSKESDRGMRIETFGNILSRRRANGLCLCFLITLSVIFLTSILLLMVSNRAMEVNTHNSRSLAQKSNLRWHPFLLLRELLWQAWDNSFGKPQSQAAQALSIGKSKRLPQCIIIGARKCGTRALIDMLNLHPQVEKAALEVHFFDRDENFGLGLDWYRRQMPDTNDDQMCLEKSPSYFVTPEVPERIHGMNSSIKLLLIVREPVTRVISDYTQIYGTNSKAHNGTIKLNRTPRLEEMVLQADGSVNVQYKAIRISMYARYLQRWLDLFPLQQLHIIDGDALIRDPYPVVKEVERFLGLQPRLSRDNFYFNVTKGFYCWRRLDNSTESSSSTVNSSPNFSQVPEARSPASSSGLHCLNDSKGRRHPQVDMRIVSKLRRFYNPHNLRFYEMVSRDFGWPEQ